MLRHDRHRTAHLRGLYRGGIFILCSLGLIVAIRHMAVGWYHVRGSSMEPTLTAGNYVFADKTPFKPSFASIKCLLSVHQSLQRGNIVVFVHRSNKDVYLIKRIVGLPHDTLAMQGGSLFLNGKRLKEPYLQAAATTSAAGVTPGAWHYYHLLSSISLRHYAPTPHDWGPIAVPENRYFVLGDNRSQSGDSIDFGFVRHEDLIGKAFWFF